MIENKSGRSKIIDLYKKTILKNEKDEIDLKPSNRNKIVLLFALVLVVVANVVLFLYDFYTGTIGLNNTFGIIGLGTITLLSFLMIFYLLLLDNISEIAKRIIDIIYKLLVLASVTLIVTNHNIELEKNNIENFHMSISFATFYLLIIAISPSNYLTDGIFLGIAGAVTVALPLFLPGKEYYNILFNAIFFVVIIIIYAHFYISNKVHIDNQKKLIQINENLINASYLDAMTDTFNRRAYYEYIHHLNNDETVDKVGVLIFDIDDFKAFNDLYSHSKGDNCLQIVSSVVMGILDEEEIFLFRYGGEEFVAFIDNPNKEHLVEVAKKMVEGVYERNIQRYDTQYKRVTITCGAAILKVLHGVNADYVIKADEQLYKGKNSGKNCVVFEGEIR